MADQQHQKEGREQAQQMAQRPVEGIKSLLPDEGPSGSQVLAVAALFPVGGILLTLSGVTLVGTLIVLALATPVFVIFSPVLFPAALTIGLAVLGFLASGAMGLTGLSTFTWVVNCLRNLRTKAPEHIDHAKRRAAEAAGQVGQRTKEVGEGIQRKAHETART